MREADRLTSERHNLPGPQLMENAGKAVVHFLRNQMLDPAKSRMVILCGKGNNGGDGLVVARLLKELGASPRVLLFASPDSVRGDARLNLERWKKIGGEVQVISGLEEWNAVRGNSLSGAEIIVDALLGTGLTGPVEGCLAQVIRDVNDRTRAQHGRPRVLAVDIPSGLPSDGGAAAGPAIRADWTVTFTAPKVGQLFSPDSECVGHFSVHSIGTPGEVIEQLPPSEPDLRWLEPSEFLGLPMRRRADSHKGSYGHALIVAGSRGKAGAAALAGWGALRAGVGLVTVATPESSLPIVAGFRPELMTVPLVETDTGAVSLRNFDYNRFTDLAREKSVLALGPGLGTHAETQQFVRRILAECPLPIVLDADGLNALAAAPAPILERHAPALVLTPHPGEMARLLGCSAAEVQSDRLGAARKAAGKYKAFVVLKGFHTIVAAPGGKVFVNSTGNPGMATAGTGDVLTGMLAGLTAQFGAANWERVLGLAVYLHGLAGDFASARVGESPLVASDLLDAIPDAFHRLDSELEDAR
jgi:NAD(P)H-hydrate epimerase